MRRLSSLVRGAQSPAWLTVWRRLTGTDASGMDKLPGCHLIFLRSTSCSPRCVCCPDAPRFQCGLSPCASRSSRAGQGGTTFRLLGSITEHQAASAGPRSSALTCTGPEKISLITTVQLSHIMCNVGSSITFTCACAFLHICRAPPRLVPPPLASHRHPQQPSPPLDLWSG